MKISENGLHFIKNEEGCILHPYKDSKGLWTIGVGHLIVEDEHFGNITEKEAIKLLFNDIKNTEKSINNLVKVPLNQNQFDAICSLVFNIGSGNFKNSTLLKFLNSKNCSGAAEQFPKWKFVNKQPILLPRRMREKELFRTIFRIKKFI